MSDFILINGDLAVYSAAFEGATVTSGPGVIEGSGRANVNGQPVCVTDDEKTATAPGAYVTSSHPIPGSGILEISALADDQVASKTRSANVPVLLVGSDFEATFKVQAPAMQPTATGPVADTTTQYKGSGSFTSSNGKFKGV